MRIATSAQMAAIDRETIEGGVSGLELMERAGREMVYRLLGLYQDILPPAGVAVCCGKGNNGGDGLVVARLLAELGYDVSVMLLKPRDELSPDALANLVKLPDSVSIEQPDPEAWIETWQRLSGEAELLVDAVFGTGIKPPVRGPYVDLFASFDLAPAPVVSLDIPSGVDGDDGRVDPAAVLAATTITVGLPKLGLMIPPGRDYAGRLEVVDIGFPEEICRRHTDRLERLDAAELARWLPRRPTCAHKYDCGTVLVLAGSRGYGGAPLLAGMGALRSGAGLVTLALPEVHVPAAVGFAPEAVVRGLPCGEGGGLAAPDDAMVGSLLDRQKALAVGPGMGADPELDAWLPEWLAGLDLPMVVDADGLNAFARRGMELRFRSREVVLTPHDGEFARLADRPPGEEPTDRIAAVRDFAARTGCVVAAKGSPTLIASPDGRVIVNDTGNDSLAHGGTGDVLTGLMGGLLAQGAEAFEAAVLGCRLHGRAGEIVARAGSRRSVLAREVSMAIAPALAELGAARHEVRF